jgi:repressor LexA
MNVGEYIKSLRIKYGYSQEQLGKLIGVQRAAVQKWECGKVQNLKRETIKKLSDIFNVPASSFIDEEEIDNLIPPTVTDDVISFPVIGNIAAGYDEVAVEDWSGETVDVPVSYLRGRNKSEFFVLKVKGDSMYPLYHEGDKVLILKQSTLNRSGDIGAVMYEGECATLKKVEYVPGEDWMRLIPLNPNYIPKTIEGVELENCRVLGIPFVLIREFY